MDEGSIGLRHPRGLATTLGSLGYLGNADRRRAPYGERSIQVFGNTQGLKASQVHALERLYRRRLPSDRVVTHEFARELLWREYPTDSRGSPFRQFWDVSRVMTPGIVDPERARRRFVSAQWWSTEATFDATHGSFQATLVEVAGKRIATTLAGGYFGEIALLRDVPRTATVRAVGDVELYALERDVFLDAVTGSSAAHELADSVAEQRIRNDEDA